MIKRIAYGMSFTYPCPRKLREIMKMSLIEKEPTSKVEDIWKEYHSARINNTCTVLSKEKYNFIAKRYLSHQFRASSAPIFLLPIFRKGGHFKLISQWQNDCFVYHILCSLALLWRIISAKALTLHLILSLHCLNNSSLAKELY